MRIEYFDDFQGYNKYAFLSNFYPSPITMAGRWYPTGEHAFAAFKAGTLANHEAIRLAASPNAAKALGRSIPLRSDWEVVKYDVMRQVLRIKFARRSMLGAALERTGNALLVEGTDWNDKVWGVVRPEMVGRNWLGHLLMARRAELFSDEPDADSTEAMQLINNLGSQR
jgi:ribA/ribD-fused uncharacterized protein